ncbi:hypothetical protein GA0115243_101817 [Streptomyces sp. ScaeMP-e83]|nr:hypothetical protein GA0115243_101817 [Streptomyces sp. ScaeMP-e83]
MPTTPRGVVGIVAFPGGARARRRDNEGGRPGE